MKQIISRIIQIFLIMMVGYWICSSYIVTSMVEDFTKDDSCMCEGLETDSQKQELFNRLVLDIDSRNKTINQKLENSSITAEEYFIHIKYLRDIEETDQYRCLISQSGEYNRISFWVSPNIGNSIYADFNKQVRSGKISADQIDIARDSVLGKRESTPITRKQLISVLSWLVGKLFPYYLFFGFIIFIGSLNKVWRNPQNEALFDPRNKKWFILDLLIWPIRLFLWIKGTVSIRRYGDAPLRVFSEQERELLNIYTRSFGRQNIHSFFESRNIYAKRSFIVSLVLCISLLSISNTQACSYSSCEQNMSISEINNNAPPDIYIDIQINNYENYDFYSKYYIQENLANITFHNFFIEKIKHIFVYIIFPKKIYKDVPWNPPKTLKIISC